MKEKEKKFIFPVLIISFCLIVFGGFAYMRELAMAASTTVPDIKIAVVESLSGALSRNGNLVVQGTKAAMGWVNDNGGIKSLGGAKLVPIIGDTGSKVEGAASAMERVCRDPDIMMAVGSWGSSLTMATTEITERLGIPHFSFNYADWLHERGFKWGFYVLPPSAALGKMAVDRVMSLARASGDTIKTAMIVTDNQAGSKTFCDAVKKVLPNVGIKLIGEEIFTMGTLTDATPIMQSVKRANPDIVIFAPGSVHENQLLLMKRREMRINIPFIGSEGSKADSDFRQVGAESLEGLITLATSFPHRLEPAEWVKRSLDQCRKEYSDEPWVGGDLDMAWFTIPVMAEILERAGSRNRQAIWEVARKLDIHDVMATRAHVKQGIAFDERGRVAEKYQDAMLVQWQGGIPKVVDPPELAVAKPIWSKRK